MGEAPSPLAKNLLSFPIRKIPPSRPIFYPPCQRFIPALNNNFHVITQQNSFLAVVIAAVPFLSSYSVQTGHVLILILINNQYLQNAVFSFEKV